MATDRVSLSMGQARNDTAAFRRSRTWSHDCSIKPAQGSLPGVGSHTRGRPPGRAGLSARAAGETTRPRARRRSTAHAYRIAGKRLLSGFGHRPHRSTIGDSGTISNPGRRAPDDRSSARGQPIHLTGSGGSRAGSPVDPKGLNSGRLRAASRRQTAETRPLGATTVECLQRRRRSAKQSNVRIGEQHARRNL